jgi:FSR family fosmidomycin resistance protein-like MFS transporter
MTTATANPLREDAQVISLVAVAHGVSHFYQLLLVPLFPWLKEAFSLSYAELGFLVSSFFAVSCVAQIMAGFVVDRVGARAVLFFGLGCLGVAALFLSIAPNYAALFAGSVLAGLGHSVFHPTDYTLLNKKISAPRLGHAFSVHSISGNIGWAAAPLFMTTIAGLAGWRNALLSAAFIPLAVLLLLVVYRDSLYTGDGKKTAAAPAQRSTSGDGVLDFMRIPAIWMCFVFFFLTAMVTGGVQTFSSASLRALYGMSLAWATLSFTIYMLTSAAGIVWGGFVASKTSRHERTIAVAFLASAALALVLAAAIVPSWMAVVLMGAIGFGTGVAGPSRDLLIRAAAPKNATGRVYGVVYSGLDIGVACSALLFGALMDAGHPSWLFIGIAVFLVTAILMAARVNNNTVKRAGAAIV